MRIMKIQFAFLMILSLVFALSSCKLRGYEIRIFADLSECRAISAQPLEGVEVTVYETADKDKYVKDLEYTDFYGCHYSTSELEFDLFAYEFVDNETACTYFNNVTGLDSIKEYSFLDSTGMFTNRRAVYSENLAYVYRTESTDGEEVEKIVNSYFSKQLAAIEFTPFGEDETEGTSDTGGGPVS